MRRITERKIFQKFRRERRYSTTTTTKSEGGTEFSKHSSSHEEYNEEREEHFYGGGAGNDPKALHYTQSLQDASAPFEIALPDFSKEFPELQREPRQYRPRQMREEQNELTEEHKGDEFLRRQQRKLFELREEIDRQGAPEGQVNGRKEGQPHFWASLQRRTDQREREQFAHKRREHNSLPPLDRNHHHPQAQLHFEMVQERVPAQLVHSVHQQSDAAARQKRAETRGFSPFPVFGPFSAQPRASSLPRRSSLIAESNTLSNSMINVPPPQVRSTGQAQGWLSGRPAPTEQWMQRPQPQPVMSSSSAFAGSSGDEWQSAYEFLPPPQQQGPPKMDAATSFVQKYMTRSQTETTTRRTEREQQQQQQLFSSRQDPLGTQNGRMLFACDLPEECTSHTYHLHKLNAYSRQLAAKRTLPSGELCSAKLQCTAAVISSSKYKLPVPATPITNSTISDRQANEEVHTLMSTGLAPPGPGRLGGPCPRELVLPERVTYHGQPVKVEITGPVHFLHATNLNVNTTNVGRQGGEASGSPLSLSSTNVPQIDGTGQKRSITGDLPTAQQHLSGQTSWEQHRQQNNGSFAAHKQLPDPDGQQRSKRVISPPVQAYIDRVCDFAPIFAELGQTLKQQHKVPEQQRPTASYNMMLLTPAGNLRKQQEAPQVTADGRPAFAYRIETGSTSIKRSTGSAERPNSAPYLVESTSHCHLARVTEIAQEWRIVREPGETAECSAVVTPVRLGGPAEVTPREKRKKSAEQRRLGDTRRRSSDDAVHRNSGGEWPKWHYSTLHSQKQRQQAQVEQMARDMYRRRSVDMADDLGPQPRFEALRSTLSEVEHDLDSAREYSRQNRNNEAQRIERAILAISERIQRPQEPVSRAQAEAKEELLRVRLAQMILNLDPDFEPNITPHQSARNGNKAAASVPPDRRRSSAASVSEYSEALRAPIGLLREKLRMLEHRLAHEDVGSINEELRRLSATPPLKWSVEQRRRHEALNQRSDEIARMTPLIGMLRHKLSALDEQCARMESEQAGARLTPYEERKTVHELLVCISREIETIHELSRREDVQHRLDTVLAVLKKVASSVDQIMSMLDDSMGAPRESGEQPPNDKHDPNGVGFAGRLGQAVERRETEEAFLRRQKHRANQIAKEAMLHAAERDSEAPQQPPHFQPLQIAQQQSKKPPPQVAQMRKSMSSSMDEQRMLGPLYSIVEEHEGQHPLASPPLSSRSEQWVNAVELSAHFVGPADPAGQRCAVFVHPRGTASSAAASNYDPLHLQMCFAKVPAATTAHSGAAQTHSTTAFGRGTGGKERAYERMKRRFDERTPPRIVHQQWQQAASLGGHQDEDERGVPIAFRMGACPPSYLEPEHRQQRPAPGQQGLLHPRAAQHKYLRLQQQHYLCSSQEEEDEDQRSASMDSSSLSVPILFRKKGSICSAPPETAAAALNRETAILTDEEEDSEEHCTDTFFLRRRRKHAVLNAVIYPEQRARVRATLSSSGEASNFQVEVERVSECGRDSVVMVSEEFYDKRVLLRSGSPVRNSTIMEAVDSSDDDEPGTPIASGTFVQAQTKMAVSISARSERDSVHVFLEEIPCGQIEMQLQATPTTMSPTTVAFSPEPDVQSARSLMASSMDSGLTGRDSVFRQVNVSESMGDAECSRSLRSSRRSSQKSLLSPDGGEELDDIPAYVIKTGSTASITCELNNDCVEQGAKIEWFRGQNEQIVPMGDKFERVSGDLVEILVIMDVAMEDAQLYSVKINGELFPVAYLIVEEQREDGDEMDTSTPSGQTVVGLGPEPQFLTAPQTQFVLQGETAILSASMSRANLNVVWHKDGEILDHQWGGRCADGRPRVWLESTTSGWYRIIINDVQFGDQGYYYAQLGNKHTNVQLIVEERIDEREVQVSSAETDDEDLGDYLVPVGSTATIACELENVIFGYKLHWQRNHKDLDARIASADGKFEHVVSGTKHYLIIHAAQPSDSGIYSVRIGEAKFKVAQITIAAEQGQQDLSGSRIKRISSQSLNKSLEMEARGEGEEQNPERPKSHKGKPKSTAKR